MKIFIGADHGGFALKEKIKAWLVQMGHDVEDCGAFQLEAEDDYPDFSFPVAEKTAQNPDALGILFCRSGAGVVIAANKVKGVRAVDVASVDMARTARQENHANVIGIAGDFLSEEKVQEIISTFLTTPFSEGDRHARRVQKIIQYEERLA